jgi:hypothetical protein
MLWGWWGFLAGVAVTASAVTMRGERRRILTFFGHSSFEVDWREAGLMPASSFGVDDDGGPA